MSENIIANIVDKNGIDGWELNGNLNMQKSYTFETFEQCQYFCSEVSIQADGMGHHPEWAITNKGRTVTATLTTHDAGNTLTMKDY